MIFTVTELELYERCRDKWNFASHNRMHMEALVGAPALNLGTLVHQALASWVEAPDVAPDDWFMHHANQMQDEIKAKYKKRVGVQPSLEELEPMLNVVELGQLMLRNYHTYWRVPQPVGYTLVATEQQALVPIPGTPHFLEGRLDRIVQDRYGRLFDLDHKTYGNRPNEDDLQMNMQFLRYDWMLHQLSRIHGMGGEVGGVLYDGLWKRKEPPAKVDGRKGMLSDLFTRVVITHPPAELESCEEHLRGIALEMAANPAIRPHRMWDGSCRWGCSFTEVCAAKQRGEDYEYMLARSYIQRDPTLREYTHDTD